MAYTKIKVNEVQFRKDWEAGMTLREMKEKYGFKCHSSVHWRANMMGLSPRQRRARIKKSPDKHSLHGGRWELDPVKRIQVWKPWGIY